MSGAKKTAAAAAAMPNNPQLNSLIVALTSRVDALEALVSIQKADLEKKSLEIEFEPKSRRTREKTTSKFHNSQHEIVL
jgi:hypothetical protein